MSYKVGTYFDNPDSARKGAEAVRKAYKRGGGRKRQESYPEVCPQCKRKVRPYRGREFDYPNRIKAVRADGTCHSCSRGDSPHRVRSTVAFSKLPQEEQDRRVARGRQEYEALVRDRRWRGIPEEGTVPDARPTRDPNPARAGVPGPRRTTRVYARREECHRGHRLSTLYNPDGSFQRHRCYECEEIARRAKRERQRESVAA